MATDISDEPEIFGLNVDDTTKLYISDSVRWAKFIAIIFSILLVLFSGLIVFINYVYLPVYMGTGQQMSFASVVFIIAFIFLFNFFPVYYITRFCILVKKSVVTNNQFLFNKSMKYLKNHFKSIGIVTIVFIALYVLGMVVTAIKGG